MLSGLFPRFFGQYREGGFVVGKFTVSNSGATLTPVSGDSHPKLTAAGDTGQYVVTLAGGARKITLVNAYQTLIDEDDDTDARTVHLNQEDGINVGNGTIPLTVMSVPTTAADAAPADLVDTSVLVVILYVDK
jgi:hypothetical protein